MNENIETQEHQGVAAAPQNEAEASARSRRRALRAALAAEAGYILSMRAG